MLEKVIMNNFIKMSLYLCYLLLFGNSHEVCGKKGAVQGFLEKRKREENMKKKGLVIIRLVADLYDGEKYNYLVMQNNV